MVAVLGLSSGNHAGAYLRKSDTRGGDRGPAWEAEIGGIGAIGL